MSYLVMESRLGYAVVMDNSGRFLKVVNRGYEVGDIVDRVICFEEKSKAKQRRWKKQFTTLAAAACFCVVLLGAYSNFMSLYGTVQIQINPDVMMFVNKYNYVIDLEGMNQDGEQLIEDYSHFMKGVEQVTDDLADRAIEQGFLEEGGEIRIHAESSHENWVLEVEEKLVIELSTHLKDEVQIIIPDKEEKNQKSNKSQTIKINPRDVSDDSNYDSDKSDYADSDYATSSFNSNQSDYDDSSSDYDDSSSDYNSNSSSNGSSSYKDANDLGEMSSYSLYDDDNDDDNDDDDNDDDDNDDDNDDDDNDDDDNDDDDNDDDDND